MALLLLFYKMQFFIFIVLPVEVGVGMTELVADSFKIEVDTIHHFIALVIGVGTVALLVSMTSTEVVVGTGSNTTAVDIEAIMLFVEAMLVANNNVLFLDGICVFATMETLLRFELFKNEDVCKKNNDEVVELTV